MTLNNSTIRLGEQAITPKSGKMVPPFVIPESANSSVYLNFTRENAKTTVKDDKP
jgi:hypothetical protein